MKNFFTALLLWAVCTTGAAADEYEGKKSDWHGFARYDFKLGDRSCHLVTPEHIASGRPWIWRARFFGHEPQADIALLERGYHIAYCEVGGLFGNAEAVGYWDMFYAHVVGKYDLARRVALEGMSRGGLIIYNWAAKNPDKVACLYGDAPVCDISSWPGGKGSGKGSAADWNAALAAYELTEQSVAGFRGNPIDQLRPLAQAGIPILHVVGEADGVVPVAENSDIIEQRYKELGGSIEVIRKPGVDHHPHALKDPAPIVDFMSKHVEAALNAEQSFSKNVAVRTGLTRAGSKFQATKQGHVAFIGGSITEMDGYRPMVGKLLQQRFPDTQFTFTAAGIASTCSTTGAFRLEADVLSKEPQPVDLLFVEFAVNDDQDAVHARRECIRGLEGIVRHARLTNPAMDIVVTYFVNPPILEALQAGKEPLSIAAHGTVTEHYEIPTIHLAREVAERISDNRLTWKQFGGTHPALYGNRICADLVDQLFTASWNRKQRTPAVKKRSPLPDPIDGESYFRGRFLSIEDSILTGTQWERAKPDWDSIKGQCRSRFRDLPLLQSTAIDAELTLEFEGASIGAYVLAGPDTGVVNVSIDGGEWNTVKLYHHFSKGLHYPRTVMFASGLERGVHSLRMKSAADSEHAGTAVRIVEIVVN
ncbi:MAG: pimeloyl-ACP methyl ester carboxylesterase [Verrucomicrobiales bacterium]|jgi:pimeloyl-ACP methyl ester carboxylesterase